MREARQKKSTCYFTPFTANTGLVTESRATCYLARGDGGEGVGERGSQGAQELLGDLGIRGMFTIFLGCTHVQILNCMF